MHGRKRWGRNGQILGEVEHALTQHLIMANWGFVSAPARLGPFKSTGVQWIFGNILEERRIEGVYGSDRHPPPATLSAGQWSLRVHGKWTERAYFIRPLTDQCI